MKKCEKNYHTYLIVINRGVKQAAKYRQQAEQIRILLYSNVFHNAHLDKTSKQK